MAGRFGDAVLSYLTSRCRRLASACMCGYCGWICARDVELCTKPQTGIQTLSRERESRVRSRALPRGTSLHLSVLRPYAYDNRKRSIMSYICRGASALVPIGAASEAGLKALDLGLDSLALQPVLRECLRAGGASLPPLLLVKVPESHRQPVGVRRQYLRLALPKRASQREPGSPRAAGPVGSAVSLASCGTR